MSTATTVSSVTRWRQIGLITLGAAALYAGFRHIPTGTNLSHMDFRVTGGNAIEFCDPSNPQFIPVVAVRSPVSMRLKTPGAARAGEPVELTVSLSTSSGKLIGPQDLMVAHTRKLHLLIVDPELRDYQHVHPEPGAREGEWVVRFTPERAGVYRVFADFMPAATLRGLYASADLSVLPGGVAQEEVRRPDSAWVAEKAGYRFEIKPGEKIIRAGRPAELSFTVTRPDGEPVPLAPVMDAYAHLVAFDEERSGFAHLHPNEIDLSVVPDPVRPELTFQVTIPAAGRYVIWSQVEIGGQEIFVPFWFKVAE